MTTKHSARTEKLLTEIATRVEISESARLILQACKEAGLKFIPEFIANAYGDRPTWFEFVEEIEI